MNWKIINGFDGYSVSDTGLIKNNKTGRILKTRLSKKGYVTVTVRPDGRSSAKNFRIHREVAEAFIYNELNLPQVNHKNCDKTDNHVSNLEWVTAKENINHAIVNGRRVSLHGEDNSESKLTDSDVREILRSYIPFCNVYGSRALSKKFGVGKSTIGRVVRREDWKHISID